ncbi:sodium-dependent phosphate transport protein 2C-like [Dermatophagoides pteronyssinus]|uniref:sodium-dependent phosphate transport protein 2C-like n=1 Tax=Dermatophagoides pteronyssinus TaxID=6956 RepID=UPI003F6669E9
MSVYSTVPNSNIFFKQVSDSNRNFHNSLFNNNFDDGFITNSNENNRNTIKSTSINVAIDHESLNQEEFQIALTPPNTPTHGVIINTTGPPEDEPLPTETDNDPFGEPRTFILMNNSDSTQSTPSDLRSMCDTPDSQEPWNIPQLSQSSGPKFNELDFKGKFLHITIIILKFTAIVLLLYSFICSLELLSTSFRLLGARVIGNFFQDNELLQNPVVGLMIGVLVTVLVQSSSTSTSIAVTMVASRIIHVRQAIPIMMGANIGTSVTNTIVSLMQSADREEFGRAFAAATVHDMFNWLTVMILLPLEMTTHYLERITTFLVTQSTGELQQDKSANHQFLNHLTKPLTNRIIQIDKDLLEEMAYGNHSALEPNRHLLIPCCSKSDLPCYRKCSLFGWLGFADTPTGLILLGLSILVLCLCLMSLVKVLNSMLTGQIAKLIKSTMNRTYAFPYSLIADYSAILAGCILTMLVQSSSIFTSALTPLAGIGIISLEKIYPLTLGANIGTTTTGILAALAADPNRLRDTMQIALCHLFFNISGILLFYPIPCTRIPIPLARMLGHITARYRWFSIFYLLLMFFMLPLIVFSLSTLGSVTMLVVGIPFMLLAMIIVTINLIQHHHPHWLPSWLKNWRFLPLWMRSLDPLDRLISRLTEKLGCANCCATSGQLQHIRFERGHDGTKLLGHHSDTHHSQLHILGAMYRSSSEQNLNESLLMERHRHHRHHQPYDRPSVPETIKRVISKLAKASQINLSHQNIGNVGNGVGRNNMNHRHRYSHDWQRSSATTTDDSHPNWSLFNSHTVHAGSQVHRYHYPSALFSRANNTQMEYVTTRNNNQSTDIDHPLNEIDQNIIPLSSSSPPNNDPLATVDETKIL